MDALTRDSLAKAEGGTIKKGEEAPKETGNKGTKQGDKGGEAAPKDGGGKD